MNTWDQLKYTKRTTLSTVILMRPVVKLFKHHSSASPHSTRLDSYQIT